MLADKPWLTASRQLPYLAQVTVGPCVAMDLMTGPYSLRAQVMAQVVHTPELFGTFVTHEGPAPAIELASVHHLVKQINGQPLQGPGWYYDTTVQGDGVVDVQAHMVAQVQAWVLGEAGGEVERDIVLDSAYCWPTAVGEAYDLHTRGVRRTASAPRCPLPLSGALHSPSGTWWGRGRHPLVPRGTSGTSLCRAWHVTCPGLSGPCGRSRKAMWCTWSSS